MNYKFSSPETRTVGSVGYTEGRARMPQVHLLEMEVLYFSLLHNKILPVSGNSKSSWYGSFGGSLTVFSASLSAVICDASWDSFSLLKVVWISSHFHCSISFFMTLLFDKDPYSSCRAVAAASTGWPCCTSVMRFLPVYSYGTMLIQVSCIFLSNGQSVSSRRPVQPRTVVGSYRIRSRW